MVRIWHFHCCESLITWGLISGQVTEILQAKQHSHKKNKINTGYLMISNDYTANYFWV